MANSNQLRENFISDGFILVKGLANKLQISKLLEGVFNVYCKYNNSTNLSKIKESWLTNGFHKELIQFRKTHPKYFSAIYDTAQSFLVLDHLLSECSIVNIVTELLATTTEGLSITGRQFRMDTPFDERNKVKWHQDISYFRNEGLVIWIPLSNVNEEIGALFVCPKSHNAGDVLVESNTIDHWETTKQREIKQEIVKKYEVLQIPMEKGDILFTDKKLFHRSGDNTSDKIRFSALARFSISNSKNFLPFRESRSYNPYIAKELGKKLYN